MLPLIGRVALLLAGYVILFFGPLGLLLGVLLLSALAVRLILLCKQAMMPISSSSNGREL